MLWCNVAVDPITSMGFGINLKRALLVEKLIINTI